MTAQERERMLELCKRIAEEKDADIFDRLVLELNNLLEAKHQRIHPEHKTKPS